MANYGFYFRSASREGEFGRLYLRITHKEVLRRVVMPYMIHPREWDAGRQQFVMPRDNTTRKRQLSGYGEGMACDLRHLEAIVRELEVQKKGRYTIDDIMHRYRPVSPDDNMLLDYANRLAIDLERRGQGRTARGYRTAVLRLQNFNGGRDVNLKRLTAGMIRDFQLALQSEGISMVTISFYMRTLRAIYNKAVEEGRIPRQLETPFDGVYTEVEVAKKVKRKEIREIETAP